MAHDDPIDAVLAEYMLRIDQGQIVDREAFIRAHPEAAGPLRAFFADADVFEAVLGPEGEAIDQPDAVPERLPRATKGEPRPPSEGDPEEAARAHTFPEEAAAGNDLPGLGNKTDTAEWIAPQPAGRSGARACVPPLPESIGRYQIRRVLGEGAFGKVYLGHDAELDRPVAIKLLLGKRFATSDALDMLQAEARMLAKLKHPAIVAVYDVGRVGDGGCFMVMEYVAGGTLKERLQSARPGLREAIEGVVTAAAALYHAHQQGFVHRDIKPGNLLLDREGGFHVADFGLAIHEDQQQKLARHTAGTPAYMAPEQVRGETHRLDGRTDVWALGVVLYEVLTLKKPFSAESREELDRAIESVAPQPPTEIDPSIPPELERICLKCLAKRMTQRYHTALDLAHDLQQWLEGSVAGQTPRDRAGQVASAASDASRHDAEEHRPGVSPIVPRGLRSFTFQDQEFYLELLPGPHDRDGLPESVSFWKSRLENIDDGDACALMYGPSGCGKSSLVKAGILPRLAGHVIPVYLEAVPDATEARLLRELRARCPQLPVGSDLAEALANLRGGRIAWPDRKIVIVLDQFEQWLHAHRTDTWGELVRALRQCDGRRLQCLLLVRDDFWLATARLLQSLEVALVEGRNVGLVDLVTPVHAKAVLTRFGQAYGALPPHLSLLTTAQQAFLDRAIDALAQDGKVVPVRLSLFADMVKAKPWVPETLEEVGGADGLVATFLEESFGQRTANPQHRRHRPAAVHVLRALLPEHGGDLRGRIRSHKELIEIAGYGQAPADFVDLVRVLDSELRLITPTDPEGQPTSTTDTPSSSGEKYYQLSHDFLVPSVREWLVSRDRRTWRGRARLVLEDRAVQWNRTHQTRYLPSPVEYAQILAGVPRRRWKSDQRAVMGAATQRYGLRTLMLVAVLILATWGVWQANGRIQGWRLSQAVLGAQASGLESLLNEELPPYQRWADPWLREAADDESRPPLERLRAGLALVPFDAGQAGFLRQHLLDCPLDVFPVVRNRLALHGDGWADDLWEVLRDRQQTHDARFRAGLALAAYRPEGSQWTKPDTQYLAMTLVSTSPDSQRDVRDYLRPIAAKLVEPLGVLFADENLADGARVAAAVALADYAADRAELLAELAASATATQYPPLWSVLKSRPEHRDTVVRTLRRIVRSPTLGEASVADRIHRGRQNAGAAITLVRLGLPKDATPALEVHDDPEAVAQLIHGLKLREVPAAEVFAWLETSPGDQARYALLLTLGAYSKEDLLPPVQARLLERLRDWYAHEPSSAVHSACGWLLRRWGHSGEVAEIDAVPQPPDSASRRTWFRDKIGEEAFGFIAFAPGTFAMGSPEWDPERNRDETLHTAEVTRPFAICDREVTRRQYEAFLHDTRKRLPKIQEIAPTPEHAMMGVQWYDAVHFCYWLTAQAGMGEADQCYRDPRQWQRNPGGAFVNIDFMPERPGYRLPTEVEWEYACRAGTVTPFGFGSDDRLLDEYAWFFGHAARSGHVPGELRPNLRGLFDMHGNAMEWCDDVYRNYPTDKPASSNPSLVLQSRVVRGGGWSSRGDEVRSAFRRSNQPDVPLSNYGFRLAKTLVPQRGPAAK